jgi:hypothetical protein
MLRQLGDKSYVSYTLLNLGTIASARHDYERAGDIYRECLGLRKELQERRGIVTCLAALGCTASGLRDYRKAAILFGAFEAQREATGASIPAIFRNEYERQVKSTTAALGEAAFAEAWAIGRAMTMDQAVDNALKEPSRV